jgi:hypothetical protein
VTTRAGASSAPLPDRVFGLVGDLVGKQRCPFDDERDTTTLVSDSATWRDGPHSRRENTLTIEVTVFGPTTRLA